MILSTFDKELYEKDLREEAFDEGVKAGEMNKLRELVSRKLGRGKSVEQIADELEESVEVIESIIKQIKDA